MNIQFFEQIFKFKYALFQSYLFFPNFLTKLYIFAYMTKQT